MTDVSRTAGGALVQGTDSEGNPSKGVVIVVYAQRGSTQVIRAIPRLTLYSAAAAGGRESNNRLQIAAVVGRR